MKNTKKNIQTVASKKDVEILGYTLQHFRGGDVINESERVAKVPEKYRKPIFWHFGDSIEKFMIRISERLSKGNLSDMTAFTLNVRVDNHKKLVSYIVKNGECYFIRDYLIY